MDAQESPTAVVEATLAEYRRVGEGTSFLTVEVPVADAAALAGARLLAPGFAVDRCEPLAITLCPGERLARLFFAVDRGLPGRARNVLEIVTDAGPRILVPEPVLMPTVGAPDTDLGDALVWGLQGQELLAYVTMLEKRCEIAERMAVDLRHQATESRRIAQAHREVWELRELFESRESAYRAGLERVRLADAECDELTRERDAAQAVARRMTRELEAVRVPLEDWVAEAERARAHLAAAVGRAEELESERDDALSIAAAYERELAGAREATARAAGVTEQAESTRLAAEESARRWEEERTGYEARIVSGVEAERRLHRQVEELAARLGERRRAQAEALESAHAPAADPFPLPHASLDAQRAEVAALEHQLERLKRTPR